MPLPDLDHRGLLPAGVHDGTLDEIEQRFCTNDARRALWARVNEFLTLSLFPLLTGQQVIVAGSFFSDKEFPDDVEATVIIEAIDGSTVPILRLFMTHDTIHRDYGVDFYPTLRSPGHNDFSLYFQYVGPKTAAAKGLNETDLRGVVRVV